MQSCTSPANLLCFPALRSPCDVCDSNNIAYTVYNPYRQPQVHSHLSVVYTFAYYTPTYLSAHLLPPLSDSSSVSVCAAYLTVKLIQWANSGGPIGSESESKPIWIYDIGSTELQPELPFWASAPLTYSEYLELITFVSLADGCEITDRQLEPLSRGGVDLSDPSTLSDFTTRWSEDLLAFVGRRCCVQIKWVKTAWRQENRHIYPQTVRFISM